MAANYRQISLLSCSLVRLDKVKSHLPTSRNVYMVLSWILLTHAVYNYTIFNVGGILRVGRSDDLRIYIIGLTQMIVLLLYPVAGIIGEVYWNRYKIIVTGTAMMLISLIAAPLSFLGFTFAKDDTERYKISGILVGIVLVPFQIGLALFQSNIIQFGTDQLLFAPTGQLSNFVHWSFWCMYLLPFVIAIISSLLKVLSLTTSPLVQFITLIVALVLMFLPCTRKRLEIHQKNKKNPLKQVYGVIKYAINNKYPRNPSAFIYNDEEHHNRINFAKKRYGGPYTTEEVEDVKTFGRITVLFLSLFGFLFIDNTGILVSPYDNQDMANSSSRFEIASQFLIRNFTSTFFVIIIGVPVYKLILCSFVNGRYLPTMIKRMGIGLVCVFLSLVVQMVLSYFQNTTFNELDLSVCGRNISTSEIFTPENNFTFSSWISFGQYISIVPQLLNGFSLLLTFLTALEFILAQSPRSMQGLLIGFWYAIQSINVLISTVFFTTDVGCSYISYGIRAVLVGLSFCLYSFTAYWYKGRKRQETSNINQNMIIENYTARNLRHNNYITEEEYDLSDFSIKSYEVL